MTAVTSRTTWRRRRRLRQIARSVSTHVILLAMSVAFALPFFWLVASSLKPEAQIFRLPPEWLPKPVMWSNYPSALTYIPYATYFKNTLYICTFNVVAALLSASFVAYGFSRIPWPGRDVLFVVLVATLMIPYPVTMIPTYLVFRWLRWINTFNPLTWPALTGNAFFIFLMRQFYMTIPMELSEAAKIDGCSELAIYRRIMLPLARPALATVGLFAFMWNWNDFLGPLIYLDSKQRYTIALGLYGFLSRQSSKWALLMAASTVTIIPVVVLFFFAQRTFIQGITLTGIKG